MVMTILEGHVSKENWPALEQAYKMGEERREAGLEQSFLIHATKESDLWLILTIWSSLEALDKMRTTVETPLGVLMFRKIHTEPSLSIYDVVEEIHPAPIGESIGGKLRW